mmetsp:Transcript_46528/g.110592  ORF Transcript_46528/g.110592 Transcript_46528/m.110592 type:complete len:268 (-) Transcript_46528:217-1020(-)
MPVLCHKLDRQALACPCYACAIGAHSAKSILVASPLASPAAEAQTNGANGAFGGVHGPPESANASCELHPAASSSVCTCFLTVLDVLNVQHPLIVPDTGAVNAPICKAEASQQLHSAGFSQGGCSTASLGGGCALCGCCTLRGGSRSGCSRSGCGGRCGRCGRCGNGRGRCGNGCGGRRCSCAISQGPQLSFSTSFGGSMPSTIECLNPGCLICSKIENCLCRRAAGVVAIAAVVLLRAAALATLAAAGGTSTVFTTVAGNSAWNRI